MNFDQIIEALGLRKLAAAASSRRSGSSGVGQPPPGAPPRPGPPEDVDDADAEPTAESESAEEATDRSLDRSEAEPAAPDDGEADAVEGALQELRHEIDQLVADVDANEASIRGIQSQHEEVLERLDGIEEHNSQLLGVYDRLTAGINPFAEGWQARYDRVRENAESAEHRYNVVELPEGVEQDPVAPGTERSPEADDRATERAATDDEAVGFEELRDRGSSGEAAAEEPGAGRVAGGAAGSTTGTGGATAGNDAYLRALARGYATEVLLMEWLTMLVDIAGPPGALKALDYYESIGWISDDVKRRLEDLLGGARVTDATEPRTPGDLTTEEHNHSFAYIMKLAQEHHTRPTAHLD